MPPRDSAGTIGFIENGKMMVQAIRSGKRRIATEAEKRRWHLFSSPLQMVSPDKKLRVRKLGEVVRIVDGRPIVVDVQIAKATNADGDLHHKVSPSFQGWLGDSRHVVFVGSDANTHNFWSIRSTMNAYTGRVARFNGWASPTLNTGISLNREGFYRQTIAFGFGEYSTPLGKSMHNMSGPTNRLAFYAVRLPGNIENFEFRKAPQKPLKLQGKSFSLTLSGEVLFTGDGLWALYRDSVYDKRASSYLISLTTGIVQKLPGSQARFLDSGVK